MVMAHGYVEKYRTGSGICWPRTHRWTVWDNKLYMFELHE